MRRSPHQRRKATGSRLSTLTGRVAPSAGSRRPNRRGGRACLLAAVVGAAARMKRSHLERPQRATASGSPDRTRARPSGRRRTAGARLPRVRTTRAHQRARGPAGRRPRPRVSPHSARRAPPQARYRSQTAHSRATARSTAIGRRVVPRGCMAARRRRAASAHRGLAPRHGAH